MKKVKIAFTFFLAFLPTSSFAEPHAPAPAHALTIDLRPRFACEADLFQEDSLRDAFPWLAKKGVRHDILLNRLARTNPLLLRQDQALLEIAISALLCPGLSKLGISTYSFLEKLERDLNFKGFENVLSTIDDVKQLLRAHDSQFRRHCAEQLRARLDRENALAIEKSPALKSGEYTVPLTPGLLKSAVATAHDAQETSLQNLILYRLIGLAKLNGLEHALLEANLHRVSFEDEPNGKAKLRDRVEKFAEERRSTLTALLEKEPEYDQMETLPVLTEKGLKISSPEDLSKFLEDAFKRRDNVDSLFTVLDFQDLPPLQREKMRSQILAFLSALQADKVEAFAGVKFSAGERAKSRLYLKALLEHAVAELDHPGKGHLVMISIPPPPEGPSWNYGEILSLEGEARRLAHERTGEQAASLDTELDSWVKWVGDHLGGGIPAQSRIDFYRLNPQQAKLFNRMLEGASLKDLPYLVPLIYHPTGKAILKYIVTEQPHIVLDAKDTVLPPAELVRMVRDYFEKQYDVKLSADSKDLRDLRMYRYLLEERLEGSAGIKALVGKLPHIEMRASIPEAKTEADRYYSREARRSLRNLTLLRQPDKLSTLSAGDKTLVREYLETRLEELGRTIDELDVNVLHEQIWHRKGTEKPQAQTALQKAQALSRAELGEIALLLFSDKAKLVRHGTNFLLGGNEGTKLPLSPVFWEKFELEKDPAKREARLKEVTAKVKAMPFYELAELAAYLKGGTYTQKFIESEICSIDLVARRVRGEDPNDSIKEYGLSLAQIGLIRQRMIRIKRLLKNWDNVKPVWDLVWAEVRQKEKPVKAKQEALLKEDADRASIYERVGKLSEQELLDLLTVVKRDRYSQHISTGPEGELENGEGIPDLYQAVSDAIRFPRAIFQDKLALIRRLKDLEKTGKSGNEEAKELQDTIKRLDAQANSLGQGEALDDWALHSHDQPWDLLGEDSEASLANAGAIEKRILDRMDPKLKIHRKNGTAQNLQFMQKKAYIYDRVSRLSSATQHELLSYLTNRRQLTPDEEILHEAVQDALFLPPLGKFITYPDGRAPTDGFVGKVYALKKVAAAAGQGNSRVVVAYARLIRSIDASRGHENQPADTARTAEMKDGVGVRVINLPRFKRAALTGARLRLRLSPDPNLDADVLEYIAAVFHFSELPKAVLLNLHLEADVDYLPKQQAWKVLNAYRAALFSAFRNALAGQPTPYDHLSKIGNLRSDKSRHELLAYALGALLRMVDRALIDQADWIDKLEDIKGHPTEKSRSELKFPAMEGDIRDYIALLSQKPDDTPEDRRFRQDLATLRHQVLDWHNEETWAPVHLIFLGENTLPDFPLETIQALRRLPEFAREVLVKAATKPTQWGTPLEAGRLTLNPTTEGVVRAAWEDPGLRRILVEEVLTPTLEQAMREKRLPPLPDGISLNKVLRRIPDQEYEVPAELRAWLARSLEAQVANPHKEPDEPYRFQDPALAEALTAILQATEREGHGPKAGALFARDKNTRESARGYDADVASGLYVREKKACDQADRLQRYALEHFRRVVKQRTKHDLGVQGRLMLCSLGDPYIELMLLIEKKIPALPGAARKRAAADLVSLAENASAEDVMKAALVYAPDAASYINSLPLEDYLKKAILGELVKEAETVGEKGDEKPIELSVAAKSKLKLLTHLATMKLAAESLLQSQDPKTQRAYQKLFAKLGPQIELQLRREAALKLMSRAQEAVQTTKEEPERKEVLEKLLRMTQGQNHGLNALILPAARLRPECASAKETGAMAAERCLAEEISFVSMELARREEFNGHLGEFLESRGKEALPNVVEGKTAKTRKKYEEKLSKMMADTELELRANAAAHRDALRQVAWDEAWNETLKQLIQLEETDYRHRIGQSGRSESENLKKPEFREKKHRLERLKKALEASTAWLARDKKDLALAKDLHDSVDSTTKDNLRKIAEDMRVLLADQQEEEQTGLDQLYRHLGRDYLLYRLEKRQAELKAREEALSKQADDLRARKEQVPKEVQAEIRNLDILRQNIAGLQTRLKAAAHVSRLGPRAFAASDDPAAESHVAAAGDRLHKFAQMKERGIKLARALLSPDNASDATHLDDPEAKRRFLAKIKSDPATGRLYHDWAKDLHDEFRLDETHAQKLFLDNVRSIHPESIAAHDASCATKIEVLEKKHGMRWNGYAFDMTRAHLYRKKGPHTESLSPSELAELESQMRATKECSSRDIDPWEAFRYELLQKFDSLGYPAMFKFGEMAVSIRIDKDRKEHFAFVSLEDARKAAQANVDETMKLLKELKALRARLSAIIANPAYPIAQGMKFMAFCLEAAWNGYEGKEGGRKWDERDPVARAMKRLNVILLRLGQNVRKLGDYGDIEVDYPRQLPSDTEAASDFRKVTAFSAAANLTVQMGLTILDEQDFREGVQDDLDGGAEATVKLLFAVYVTRGLRSVAGAGWRSRLMQVATQELAETAAAVRNGGLLRYGGAWIQYLSDPDPAHPSFRWSQYNQSQDQSMILFGAAHPITRVLSLVKWLKPFSGMAGFGTIGGATEYFMGNPNHVWEQALRSALYATPIEKLPGLGNGVDAFLASFLFNTGLDAGFTYQEYQNLKKEAERDGMPLPPLQTLLMRDLKHGAIMNLYFAGMVGLNAGKEKEMEKLKEIGHEGRTLEEVEKSLEPAQTEIMKHEARNAFRKTIGLPSKDLPTGMERIRELMGRISMTELKESADEAAHNPEKAKAIEKVFSVPADGLAEVLGEKLTPWWNPIGPNGDAVIDHLPQLRAEVARKMADRIADPKTPTAERDKLIQDLLKIMPDQAYEHLPAFHLDEALCRGILQHNFKHASPGVVGEFLGFYKTIGHNQTDTLSDYVADFDSRDPALIRKLLSEKRLSVKDAYQFFDKGLVDEATGS